MKKKKLISILFASMLMIPLACDDFLEKDPQGTLNPGTLSNLEGATQLLIGAYAMLDGFVDNTNTGDVWLAAPTNWTLGDITSDDCYKGSESSDQLFLTELETYTTGTANPFLEFKWQALYEGVARCNNAIRAIQSAEDIVEADKNVMLGEARFLRGHFHFEAIKIWKMVPYLDETVTDPNVSNEIDIWSRLEEDFQFAADNLPATQTDAGRATSWAAKAYLGKTHMFQNDFTAAKPVLDDVINNGPFDLVPDFHDNFRGSTENNEETVFAIQFAVRVGLAEEYLANWGERLAFPQGGPSGCCGFKQPSQNLVNAYQTNASGIPLLDTFNNSDVENDQSIPSTENWASDVTYTKESDNDEVFVTRVDPGEPFRERVYRLISPVNTDITNIDPLTTPGTWELAWAEDASNLDPRLDWTVGRRGIDYLGYGDHPGQGWIRDQAYAGPYSPKKHIFGADEEETASGSAGWVASNNSAVNYNVIRFADVLLWRAEVAADESDLTTALNMVNRVRRRARDGGKVQNSDNSEAANYVVDEYASFPDRDFAIQAVKFERRLELALEGHRFFDLVRWGDAASTLNTYLQAEQSKRSYLSNANFETGRDEYVPIPLREIDLSQGTLKQNF